jgi:hypothetical protein
LGRVTVDFLTLTLCICIGTAIPWLIAIYSESGARLLLWNHLFAMAGATLCALSFSILAPHLTLLGLVIAGPLCAVLMILIGNALRRRIF